MVVVEVVVVAVEADMVEIVLVLCINYVRNYRLA